VGDDVLPSGERAIRETDSNSLLRLYDRANAILNNSPLQLERQRADRAIQRVARELRMRDVPLRAVKER
jgi:hypothetical protein